MTLLTSRDPPPLTVGGRSERKIRPAGPVSPNHGKWGGSRVTELSESEPLLIPRAGVGPTRRRH